MIGVSLPFKIFSDADKAEDVRTLLTELWRRGARSIELRAVKAGDEPETVYNAAKTVWEHGFNLTVHSTVKSVETAVNDAVLPLTGLISAMKQRELIVTLHPITGDNVTMLMALADYVDDRGYPIRFALENQRRLPDKSDGDSLSLVLDGHLL